MKTPAVVPLRLLLELPCNKPESAKKTLIQADVWGEHPIDPAPDFPVEC